MALCSQAFPSSMKRSCSSQGPLQAAPRKRMCLGTAVSSSDDDTEDEQSCYVADQVRAKRRASSRSFVVNTALSRACSQYSDEDEEDTLQFINKHGMSPVTTESHLDLECGRRNSFFLAISDAARPANAPSPTMAVSADDRHARARCFDYLVGAIDEAWARYCDAATCVEDEVYGYNTPASVGTDEEDYVDNSTDITDYEDDLPHHKAPPQNVRAQFTPRMSMCGPQAARAASNASSALGAPRLQNLKDRLTKAKYYLQDLVDSDDVGDVSCFWKRWDMIKYATIELVEDDDDDEVVEATVDELESGRSY
ncbi:hypothetical protein DICA3_E01266 [Diutina catenulata]